MPGRTGRQLVLLQKHNIGPPLLGKVIQHRGADRTAADHHNACRAGQLAGGLVHFRVRRYVIHVQSLSCFCGGTIRHVQI